MATVTLRDGARLAVDVSGEGRAVVLVSGLGGTGAFWRQLVEALGDGFRTIRFDQRGIGASERGTVPVTVRTLAEDVWEIIDALALDTPVLCGHSTGGAIVQEMALLRPGAAGSLILSGTWVGPDPFLTTLFGARRELLKISPRSYVELAALFSSPPRWHHAHPAALEAAGKVVPDAAQVAIIDERIGALLGHDCRDRISEIRERCIVLGAEDDMIVPAYLQEELAAALGQSELRLFDHGGHFFPVTRAEETAAVIRRWSAAGSLAVG
jgi:pimeloyl-ACP methyl ester carboxylesterase